MYINVKMIPAKTTPGMGRGRSKGDQWMRLLQI
jgi:hypothetical protein